MKQKLLAVATFFGVLLGCEAQTPANIETQKANEQVRMYKVVAHRGGYLECGKPDCSIASLKYAMEIGCYASECDIVLTYDNDIIVAHPVNGHLINGLTPYEHAVSEIRAAGKLANGEEVPTLRDFIEAVKDKEQNPNGMKLWLDVKKLTKDGSDVGLDYSIDACLRACEIIKEMGAEDYCEFLIPTGDEIINAVRDKVVNEYKINIAWMTATHPKNYHQAWAQLSYKKIFGGNTTYEPLDYIRARVPLSVYGVDTDETMDKVIPYYPELKAIFSNYPNKLIQKLKEKGY